MTKLVDMRLTPAEQVMEGMPFNQNEYPYGLAISLDDATIEKLGVDFESFEIGDIYDLRAMSRVTAVSCNETEGGKRCRIELQIVMLGCEDESGEYDEEERPKVKRPHLYKK